MKTRIIGLSLLEDKASLCVKLDLGGNVSCTHLVDRSSVEWPLNSKTALFIRKLIDEAVIFIHSLRCQMEQIFAQASLSSSSPCLSLFLANPFGIIMEQKKPLQTFVINNNGVIKLRAILFPSVFL